MLAVYYLFLLFLSMKKINLFDYQEEMKARIGAAFEKHRSVMVQMPTGTGKTVLLASVVEAFLREHPDSSVWIVAHRMELVSQIRETIERVVFSNHPDNSSKITPSLFTIKEGNFSNHPVPLSKEGSTSIPKPLSPQGTGDVTAPLRRSEPLRSKVGGPSKVSPDCAGWDRLGENAANDGMPVKAVSVQWLAKHYDEIEEEPGMIVIDEAHHALAKTYKIMWERFPKAKFLGLTATPCRLSGKGFTDLFEVLVQSWSIPEFIKQGRLATYDFVSIKTDSVTQGLIESLKKRGADGDYQTMEMDRVLNKKPSIERLYQAFCDFGKDRKGIVYAINISHAKKIAEFYREHGVVAVAIDSKTPSSLRKELIERFKLPSSSFSNHPVPLSKEGNVPTTPSLLRKEGSTSHPSPLSSEERDVTAPPRRSEPLRFNVGGPSKVSPDCLCGVNRLDDRAVANSPIQVLVNVDIFSEGFDCPDVEFVQLARPTLSLAKYLQMVGRGLRVAPGKKNCVMIDNVGLYRVFGLPSQVWDWEATFEGKLKIGRKKETAKEREFFLMKEKQEELRSNPDSEMVMVVSHDELLQSLQYREFVGSKGDFAIIKLPDAKMTVVNRMGEQVIEPGNYYDMKLLRGNILFFRPRRNAICYYDLLARAYIEDGPNAADPPKIITIRGWEFIEYDGLFMSRTQEDFSLPFRPSKYELSSSGYYLTYKYNRSTDSGCQVWAYSGLGGTMYLGSENSEEVCFLKDDHTHVYWLCANLFENGIVVMDSKEDYYWVDASLKKTYIGSNNPKDEKESLWVVMPRIGKECYQKSIQREEKMEEKELLQLHEKSNAGNVELYQAGKKWGIKMDGKVVVPPIYLQISQPVGAYCAFEQIPRHWGVMTLKGKVLVEPKYEKVEIGADGVAILSTVVGKRETRRLR